RLHGANDSLRACSPRAPTAPRAAPRLAGPGASRYGLAPMPSPDPRPPLHVALVARDRAFSGGNSMRAGFEAADARCTIVPYEDWFPDLHSHRVRGSGLVSRLAGDVVRPLAEARLVATLARLRPDVVFFLKCDDLHGAVY